MFAVQAYDTVESTNNLVKRALEEGIPEGLVIRAACQTGGYGRQGRTWSSPRGGLYQSMLLRPAADPDILPTLGLVAALAVREALARFGCASQVKWPNDVVCEAGKLAGISFESHAKGVCVGIGVNVVPTAEAAAMGSSYAPAFVQREAEAADPDAPIPAPDEVGDALLDAFEARYRTWLSKGFAPFLDEYAGCLSLMGCGVRIEVMGRGAVHEGTVVGIDPVGRLLLETGEGVIAVVSGEAHLV